MRRTDAAATTTAVVSVTRLEWGIDLLLSERQTRRGADVTTPGAGAGSLRHRVDCLLSCELRAALGQPEYDHRTASVAHVGVIVEGADRAESGGSVLPAAVWRHATPRPTPRARAARHAH